jgi:hypothetical protein
MPNRILHERICTSETLAGLEPAEEVFFYRLLVQCDDYGRFDGRPMVIRARCYALQLDRVTDADVAGWLDAIERAGLVRRYVVDERVYLCVQTWKRYQQTRAQSSKYPEPPAADSYGNHLLASEINGAHMSPYPVSNPVSNPEANTRTGSEDAAVPAAPSRAAPKPDRQAQVIDAIGAEHVPLTFTPRDGAAIKKCSAPPAKIAAAYVAAFREEWGGDWLRDNLSVHEVINRLAGYDAALAGKGARAPNGQRKPYRSLSNQAEWDNLPPGVPLNPGFETDDFDATGQRRAERKAETHATHP